ncbi:MAG: hypothetical protein ACEPO8_07205 [Rhodothermaceae bacterium]
MIEIKIPTSAAIMLLTERMQYEFDARQKSGFYGDGLDLYDLNYRELMEIAEIAAFDLVFLLPAEIFAEKNNLGDIICKSIKALTKYYDYPDFGNYTIEQAERLIKPIFRIMRRSEKLKFFLSN